MIFTSKLGRTDPGQGRADQTLVKGPLKYYPPPRGAVATTSPSLALHPPPPGHPSSLQKRGRLSLHLQLSVYFFTSHWVLLLGLRLSENRAEIFHVTGIRIDKGETQPTHMRGLQTASHRIPRRSLGGEPGA